MGDERWEMGATTATLRSCAWYITVRTYLKSVYVCIYIHIRLLVSGEEAEGIYGALLNEARWLNYLSALPLLR